MQASSQLQISDEEESSRKSTDSVNRVSPEENATDHKSVEGPLDMHLLQKLQVLQHVNPTIKALLNLKGIG